MKITKVPGLGRFGIYVDDINLDQADGEQWQEIGRLQLEHLVTIIRPVETSLTKDIFYRMITSWGNVCWTRPYYLTKKYGMSMREIIKSGVLDIEDNLLNENERSWRANKKNPGMIRVTPKLSSDGKPLGIFGEGELLWHSNESGDVAFTPGVGLLGWESMTRSATGFCTSPDWYEKQSESFKSELNQLIVIHNYKPKSVNPRINEQQDPTYKVNFAPESDMRVPLVVKSPGGMTGIHLGSNTFDRIDGMNKNESDKLFRRIKSELITEENIYNHWYRSDKEIVLFDNSVTLHNRSVKAEDSNRLAFRIAHNYERLTGSKYVPFLQPSYNLLRDKILNIVENEMNEMSAFKPVPGNT